MNPFGSRPKTIRCSYCSREYGTASIPIHEKQCAERNYQPYPPPKRNPASSTKTHLSRAKIPPSLQKQKQSSLYSTEQANEYEEANNLVPCRRCRRTFAHDRISKHQSVCRGQINENPKPHPTVSSMNQPHPKLRTRGMPEWKKQHMDFVNIIRYAKKMSAVEQRGGDVRMLKPPPQMADPYADYIQCPYCSRKYSQVVAERHIPKCKDIINKPKPPPKQLPVGRLPERNFTSGARGKQRTVKAVVKPPNFCVICANKLTSVARYCPKCGSRR